MNPKFYIGILFFLLSYFQFLLPGNLIDFRTLSFFWFLFMLGIVYIGDGVTQKIYNKSLLHTLFKNKKNTILFLLISIAGGLLLEGTAQWLGKLWIYPYFNGYIYSLGIIFGFGLYWLMITESYLGTKAVIDYLSKGKHTVKAPLKLEAIIYRFIGAAGIILVPLSIFLILKDYSTQGGYSFDIASPVEYKVNFVYVILIFLGAWFILEYIEYYRKKTSLLKDIFHNYFSPIIAIVIASFFLAIIMETENILHGYWIYTNWPLPHIQIFWIACHDVSCLAPALHSLPFFI